MQPENALSPTDYLAAIRRRRLLVLGIVLPIVVIGAALAFGLPEYYRSTARFRMASAGVEEATANQDELFDQYVVGLADKVLSVENLTKIVANTDPYPNLADDLGSVLDELQSDVRVEMVTQTVLAPDGGRERTINTGFTVSFDHRSPEKAAVVAKRLASSFFDLSRAEHLTAAENRVRFFTGETERISKQIADFERQLADFKSANFERMPDAVQANFTIRGRAEQELEGVEREIRTLQQNRVFVVQQLRQSQSAPTTGNLQQLEAEYARKAAVYAASHPDVIALRRQIDLLRQGGGVVATSSLQSQLAAQKSAMAEARQRYSDDHPDVKRMQRDIESLEARIAGGESASASTTGLSLASMQFQTQLNAIDTQVAGLQGRAAQLRGQLAHLDTQIGSSPEVERDYQALARGLDNARAQYNQMINKRMDADVEVAAINTGSADRFTLVSAPGTPRSPAGPKRAGILVLSLLAAALLGLAAVVAAETFDSKVRGARDVRSMLGLNPLSVVPEIHNSVYHARHQRRLAVLVGSLVIGAPVAFLLVRLLAA